MSKVLYTAMVLDEESVKALRWFIEKITIIKEDYDTYYGDHMTVCLGQANLWDLAPYCLSLGGVLEIDAIGAYEGVVAVRVCNVSRLDGKQAHITISIGKDSDKKPKHANLIKNWVPLPCRLLLRSKLKEIKK